MTTQTQGKGKKKNKDSMKVSLDEFNQIDAPQGHSVINVKLTGLDWAETMADYDQQAAETQQIIVPAAPRAQRGPGIDIDSLPDEPPFRVSVYNLPMSMEGSDEIGKRFFTGLEVIRVESNKSTTTVEFATKADLYDALSKDGVSVKGRTINVCLYGQQPVNSYSDRYGSRSGGSSYGDRYGDRRDGGGFGQRAGDRYGDRSGGGFGSRDRDRDGGFGGFGSRSGGAGGFGASRAGGFGDRGGYNDRGNFRDRGQYTSGGGEPESEEPTNWRARPNIKPAAPTSAPVTYNNGSRQPYVPSRQDTSQHSAPSNQQYQQPEPYYQSRYQHSHHSPSHSPYPQNNNYQPGTDSRSYGPSSSSGPEERPKLVLAKRKTPLVLEDNASRNEAIFGKAKPSSTPYEKMKEVEEKLQAVHLDDKPPRK